MKGPTRSFYAITLMTLAAVGVFAATLIHAVAYASSDASGVPAPVSAGPIGRHPVRLAIPSLGIDAAIEHVGINSRGAVGTPASFADAGWYVYGATPGDPGIALIDGHVDNGLSLPGVFKHLSDIHIGADIAVTQHAGAVIHFRVKSVIWYGYQSTPPDALFKRTASSTLVLVTCGGAWVPGAKTYDKRLVVTASET